MKDGDLMEIIIMTAMVGMLVYILGVEVAFILQILLGIMFVAMVLTAVFFVWTGLTLIGSKRRKAVYDRIDKAEGSPFRTAVYVAGGEELRNTFPSEMLLRSLLYNKDKPSSVRVTKKGKVYDRYSLITVVMGNVLAPLSVVGLAAWFSWANVFIVFK